MRTEVTCYCASSLLLLLLLQPGGTARAATDRTTASATLARAVAREVSAAAWPSIPEAGRDFCGEAHEEATCLDYVHSLHTMLDTVAKIIETSPTQLAIGPVAPVAVALAGERDTASALPPDIRDPDLAAYHVLSVARDEKAIAAARARAAAAAAESDAKASLERVITRLLRLRRDLTEFVDKAYEASYLGDAMPLSKLGPIVRACGSLFQRVLFNWEVGRADALAFYDNLLVSEKRYVETFFELYGFEHYNFHFGLWYGNRMSSFTWSHRSKSNGKSARFACGTTSQEAPFEAAAQAVLEERGISLDGVLLKKKSSLATAAGAVADAEAAKGEGKLDEQEEEKDIADALSFYGLGWDFESRHFKLYLMVHGLPDGLPDRYSMLAKEQLAAAGIDIARVQVEQHGLISLTYRQEGNVDVCVGADGGACDEKEGQGGAVVAASTLHEEKVYVYPTAATTVAFAQSVPDVTALDGKTTANVAWLLASKRGFVAQFDTIITPESAAHWRKLLGEKGSKIMDEYEGIGMKLETVAFQDKSSWTLYFPAGSG
jgi:hypothetical protein